MCQGMTLSTLDFPADVAMRSFSKHQHQLRSRLQNELDQQAIVRPLPKSPPSSPSPGARIPMDIQISEMLGGAEY
ncbi:hypothetical protein VTO73DRAFT_2393 [Trametes versicolor]